MEKHIKNIGNFLASPTGLFAHLGILTLCFGLLVYKEVFTFNESHTERKQEYLSTEELTKLDPSIHNKPKVEVGFTIDSFNEFNVEKNTFSALGIVWFTYNPKEISLETLSDFSFLRGDIKEKMDPATRMLPNGKAYSQFNVIVKFTADLDYENFPLDDHTVKLVLKNNNLTSENVQFITNKNNMHLDPAANDLNDWLLVKHDAEVMYNEFVIKEDGVTEKFYVPYIVFSLDYTRLGLYFILLILFPLIFIFFVCLSVFLLQPSGTLDAFETMLFSLIGFLFIFQAISPEVGYLTLGNKIYFVIFLASFLPLILAWYGEDISQSRRGIIGTVIEFAMIAAVYYLVLL